MKIENARSKMLAVLDEMERQPHVYGESDCVMRVAWLAAAQVPDPKRSDILAMIERYHGKYTSLAGAYRVLKADGFTPLSLVKHFFEEIHPVDAVDGDIGAVRQDGRNWAFGIFDRGGFFVATASGTGALRRSDAAKAFRVA